MKGDGYTPSARLRHEEELGAAGDVSTQGLHIPSRAMLYHDDCKLYYVARRTPACEAVKHTEFEFECEMRARGMAA